MGALLTAVEAERRMDVITEAFVVSPIVPRRVARTRRARDRRTVPRGITSPRGRCLADQRRDTDSAEPPADRGRPVVNSDDRLLLLDLENLGSDRLRARPLRARLETLLAAAGEIHHAVAAYALPEGAEGDPLASLLAELRIAPLRVATGPDAAELALLAHARHVHAEGGRNFLVGSADHRFAELVALGRVELVVWDGQPVAAKLAEVVHHVHRLARPTGASGEDTAEPSRPAPDAAPAPVTASPSVDGAPHGTRARLSERLLTALVTGIAIAVGQRLFDTVVPRRRS